MNVGYSSQCKACNSPLRGEIDRRLLGGASTRSVAAWLATQGETHTHVALGNHRNAHCAVINEARARIIHATQPAHEAAVEKIVADVKLLDEIAGKAMSMVRTYSEPPTDMPGAVVLSKMMAEARQCVVARHDILHGKKVNIEASFSDPDDVYAKLQALVGHGPTADTTADREPDAGGEGDDPSGD
jgi:hypothetical protein